MSIIRFGFTFLLLALGSICAQGDLGTVTGTVTDSAGALMPGVRIEIRNTDSGLSHQISSTASGNYTAQLPAGIYQISTSVRGFKPYIRTGAAILGSQTMRIDIVLMMVGSDEVLTNESIIKLVKVGIHEDVIISKVLESQSNFDLSVNGMVSLKENGVSDRLMGVLLNPTRLPEVKTAPTTHAFLEASVKPIPPKEPLPKPAETTAPAIPVKIPTEAGVYVKKAEQWVDLQPEIVTYRTGGAFARLATAGIVQNDLNGRVTGAHSANVLKSPLEFLVIPPEGVVITEYQLIHLQQQRDAREFLAVVGGIFSSSGGATRDLVKYESTKMPSRGYSIKLPGLNEGEYGFLLAGADVSSTKSGKIFTFRVTD